MSRIDEVKFIDLKRSKVDEGKSDPKAGEFVFKPNGMVELKRSDYDDNAVRPKHILKWNRSDPHTIREWEIKFGAEFVTADDPYFPHGAGVEFKDGHYHFNEMVLIKIPLELHLERKRADAKRANKSFEDNNRNFRQSMNTMGMGLKDGDVGI